MPDIPTPPTIRPATAEDMSTIGELGALLVALHHDFDPLRFLPAQQGTRYGYASYLGSQLSERTVIILVAERDGEVCGYTYAGVEGYDYMNLRGPAGVLYDIVVAPHHRTQGVGKLLLDATLAELKKRGAPRVVLMTAAKNEPAQRLFAKMGFRQTMIEMTHELGDASD